MTHFRTLLNLACVATLPVTLGGCAGALVVGGLAAAAGTGYAAGQERGINGSVNDFTIKNDIAAALIKANPRLYNGIWTSVYNGRVLLTGRVPTQALKETATQIAEATRGVRAVYNNVEVAPAESAWADAKDDWITARVRSEMILDPAVRSVNYTIDTANGSVYLIGSARSQAELNRVAQIARYVPGVKRVVSYVSIRSGEPVATAAAAPTPTSPAANAAPYAAPQAPIAVQKL